MQELGSPIWYAAARKLFELVGRPENLPGPEVYLEHSASAKDSSAPMRKRLAELNSLLTQANYASVSKEDSNRVETLRNERSKLRQELDQQLSSVANQSDSIT